MQSDYDKKMVDELMAMQKNHDEFAIRTAILKFSETIENLKKLVDELAVARFPDAETYQKSVSNAMNAFYLAKCDAVNALVYRNNQLETLNKDMIIEIERFRAKNGTN